jgi:hypothetical protein
MRKVAPEMRAAAFAAVSRGGNDKARCDEFVGRAVIFAKRIDAVEGVRKSLGVSDDAGVLRHKAAKLRASCAREGGGGPGWSRRPVRLRCAIAQSRSDSLREHHSFQE